MILRIICWVAIAIVVYHLTGKLVWKIVDTRAFIYDVEEYLDMVNAELDQNEVEDEEVSANEEDEEDDEYNKELEKERKETLVYLGYCYRQKSEILKINLPFYFERSFSELRRATYECGGEIREEELKLKLGVQ